jgi:hypothetical protein
VSVLLDPLPVEVLAPEGLADAHGWVEASFTSVGVWPGNVQEQPVAGDPLAAEQGGSGPYAPASPRQARVFLPTDCPVAPGCVLGAAGRRWAVQQVALVIDPTGTGALDCWEALAVEDPLEVSR